MGYSDFQTNRRLLDWPADVGCLADTLGLDKFGVLGYSGGGPMRWSAGIAFLSG
jgi:hypothetical protein